MIRLHTIRCCSAASVLLIGSMSIADDSNKQETLQKFVALAESVSVAKVKKAPTPVARNGDGFVFKQRKELQIEFQQGATRLGEAGAAEAMFPLKATGYTYRYDSRKQSRPDTTRGADLQRVKLTITHLLSEEGKPKAQIRAFQLDHGTDYDAVQMARDEIIERIKWYLPEVEIEGRQKFREKQLVIDNQTEEPVWVFAMARTRQRSDSGYAWTWTPGEPSSGNAHRIQVAPKTTRRFEVESGESSSVLHGARVRVWAEGESGERWEEHRSRDLHLVDRNQQFDGERVYHDVKMQDYTWRIEPKSGERPFTERMAAFKNNTNEPLELRLRYLANQQGSARWRTLSPLTIPPGKTVGPLTSLGMRVRAAEVRFVAKGKSFYFNKHADKSLHLVEESEAGRVYAAEKIGQFVYVFDAKADGGR